MNKLRIALVGAVGAALIATSSAAAFTPENAYYAKQWYLSRDNAFDAWDSPPTLDPVKVAIIDSGVDCSLPDLKDQIAKTAAELIEWSQGNRERLTTYIREEIQNQMQTMGVATRSDLDSVKKRVRELERAAGMTASGRSGAKKATTRKRSTAKKRTARKSTAKKSTAKSTAKAPSAGPAAPASTAGTSTDG